MSNQLAKVQELIDLSTPKPALVAVKKPSTNSMNAANTPHAKEAHTTPPPEGSF